MDAYALNIASVQKKTGVVATDDICNSQGQIIVKKGSVLTEAMTDKIVRFKLLRPIDETIAIEGELNTESMMACFHEFIDLDPLYKEIHEDQKAEAMLHNCCENISNFPLLRQKLTVLQLELPKTFHQSVFTGWLSVLICEKLRRNKEYTKTAFLVAMVNDIGLLHIDPNIFSKQSRLTVEETKQIHAHPIIGQKILAGINGLSKTLSEAVLEHHETVGGTGYPTRKMKDRWNVFGRLIFLLDNIFGIYNNQVKRSGHSLHAVIPVVLLSSYARNSPEFAAFVQIIKQASPEKEKQLSFDDIPALAKKIRSGIAYISRFLNVAIGIVKKLGRAHNNPHLAVLQSSCEHVYRMMVESGISDKSFALWLGEVEANRSESEYVEIEKSFFLVKEIVYQIRGIKNQAQVFFANPKNKELLESFPDVLGAIGMDDSPGF